ncbi:helix-turn-helix transcriptional regulator [Nonomuraea guangzhouensis]|uniref:Helix-turn-helix transcriptional regulator n=1 Tax=Nonomuraea guangzhouensis TaxID=1291555 RepID=A0ABW4GAJ7_9ACTN|nr:helix-turn-helix domain-containing protein [Nonomuraea guangzhouensis]
MNRPDAESAPAARWTFLTNHARVLLELARDPRRRLRDVAVTAGITERTAQGIVADLEAAGYLTRVRVGRRNHYSIEADEWFRHPAEAGVRIGSLIDLFTR